MTPSRLVLLTITIAVVVFPSRSSVGNDTYDMRSNTREVIDAMERAREGYRSGQRLLSNVRVVGVLQPANRAFTYIAKDGKFRYDQDAYSPRQKKLQHIVRLNDGKRVFILNEGALGITSLADADAKFRNSTASEWFAYTMPWVEHGCQPVDQFLDWLISAIQGTGEFRNSPLKSTRADLTVIIDGTLLSFHLTTSPDWKTTEGYSFTLTLDAAQQYNMTAFSHATTALTTATPSAYSKEVRCQYREVAPTVFGITKGACTITRTDHGTTPPQQRTEQRAVDISSFSFGNFSLPVDTFDVHALSIPRGTEVHDERTTPPRDYIYNRGPFDEAVLTKAGYELAPLASPSRARVPLILILCALVISGLCAAVYRVRRSL